MKAGMLLLAVFWSLQIQDLIAYVDSPGIWSIAQMIWSATK